MRIITDNISFIQGYFSQNIMWEEKSIEDIKDIPSGLFLSNQVFVGEISNNDWNLLIAVKEAPESQYDKLIEAVRNKIPLPDKLLLIADTGKKFHGFHNRVWVAESGNIHLSVYLAPNKEIHNFGAAVMALPTVSIIQALDSIKTLNKKPMIKWVNDIFIDNKKLAGIIAHTQQQGKSVSSIIIGIGLNVRKAPKIQSSDVVPATTCLYDIVDKKEDCTLETYFQNLLKMLKNNINLLYNNNANKIIDNYRSRSLILNRYVRFIDDTKPGEPEISSGIVERIGDNLELYIKGKDTPITRGRSVML
jgi:BirA family transcriptional regulator, biotin operon repressor / biotin---[acetyl-CoA-carboxylase] ligase